MLLLLACASEQPTQTNTLETTISTVQPSSNKQPIQRPLLSAAEDLSGGWRSDLAISVKPLYKTTSCPDMDKDGYQDVWACPHLSSAEADCDDNNRKVSPKTQIWVPPSPFIMGSESEHAGADEKPMHTVFVSGFCMDTTEVSVELWAEWLRSSGRTAQGPDLRSVSPDGTVEKGRERHPAEGVTFEEASAYCEAQGKRLPTEAEFEKAARGGCEFGQDPRSCDIEDLRPYPWGTKAPNCDLANHQLSTASFPKLCVSDTLEVQSLSQGIGPYGHLHLSGNVWEYVLDYWHPKIYSSKHRKDPAGPKEGSIHTLKGGGWNTFSTNMRAANRFHDLVLGSAAGFRCVQSKAELNYDDELTLELITLSGTVDGGALGALKGRALYITAFDAADADSYGMVAPGRSPVAETKLTPNGKPTQTFKLKVPQGNQYVLSAALDNGGGGKKDDYVSASGSGGFGRAVGNVSAEKDLSNIKIKLIAAPSQGTNPPNTQKKQPPLGRPPVNGTPPLNESR